MQRIIGLLIFFLGWITVVHAQETAGGYGGMVTDSTGAPLAEVTVTAVHVPSGTKYTTKTAVDGRWHLPNMRVGGPYTITVSSAGMASVTQADVQVGLGVAGVLDFRLLPQAQELTGVVVKATARGARTDRFGASSNFSREAILRTPSISRSITDITKMVPQASKDNSFGGTNFRYNNVTIDGAINNDAIGFSPSAGGISGTGGMMGSSTRTNPISMDAIEDVQVYLAPYDVKIGNFTGGSINAVTRSGTNTVTGSVYAFGRNATLTGKENAGDKSKIPSSFHEYQTGIRVGFPIVKDKVFFFTNFEITDRVDPVTQGAASPDAARVIDATEAKTIRGFLINNYKYDPGTFGNFDTYSRSQKFFNRLDWNIDDRNQLTVRNNLVFSKSTNLERDELEFRFSGISYEQVNNQHATVAELKSRFGGALSNSLLVGYSAVHDYRDPSSNPAFPQVQIQGKTPGTTIYLGTDREASIFDMRQRTTEITDNLTWYHGKHTFLFGTHNELYNIQYGFVNAWNGRVDYQDNPATGETALETLLAGEPARVRGAYNFVNNNRDYIMANPSAQFHINFYSLYAQDEIQVSRRFRFTGGLRMDYTDVPKKQTISYRMQHADTDPIPDSSLSFTPLNQITNHYFTKPSLSPRIGFNWNVIGNNEVVLRGGSGIFTGRIPFAWLGYSFYNNGDSYGYYDQRATSAPFVNGRSVLNAPANGIAAFAQQNGQVVNNKYIGTTQVDAVDNNFKIPRVWRSNLAVDYSKDGWKLTLEGMYTKTLYDVRFTQINYKGVYSYYAYDSVAHRQPIFTGTVDPNLAAAYELGNTTLGYRYTLTGQVSKQWPMGLFVTAAYTYGQSKDVSNGIRNSMESNWQLNQSLNPNNAGLGFSNFDVRHRLTGTLAYRLDWNKQWVSRFSLYMQSQSGSPFTYGFVNSTVQNTAQQVSLAYIPFREEATKFFQDVYDNNDQLKATKQQQADAFNTFVDKSPYLSGRRGNFTERNMGRTPWNTTADFRFLQELHLKNGHVISLTWDIINLTNLVNKSWGWVYFSPNTFNSTASVGLTPYIPNRVVGGYPQYTFQDPGRPYSVDFFNSRWQMQGGLRYTF